MPASNQVARVASLALITQPGQRVIAIPVVRQPRHHQLVVTTLTAQVGSGNHRGHDLTPPKNVDVANMVGPSGEVIAHEANFVPRTAIRTDALWWRPDSRRAPRRSRSIRGQFHRGVGPVVILQKRRDQYGKPIPRPGAGRRKASSRGRQGGRCCRSTPRSAQAISGRSDQNFLRDTRPTAFRAPPGGRSTMTTLLERAAQRLREGLCRW